MVRRALLAVAVVVVLSGCGMLTAESQTTREQRAVETLDNAADALAEIETHRASSEIIVEADTQQAIGEITSTVDVTERKAQMRGTIRGMQTASYLVNETAYVDCEQPWGWGKEQLTGDEDWVEIASPAAEHLSILESGDLYYNGTVQLGEREAIRLTGTPSDAAVDEPAVLENSKLDRGDLTDATVYLWVDADTYRPVRSEIRYERSVDGESVPETVTTEFDRYNEDVSIDIPARATDNPIESGCFGS